MKKVLLSAFALLAIGGSGFAQNLPSYIPANGLVGWWPFNGNANDESGNGNNGTVNGATLTADRFGNVGKAYSFDGNGNFIDLSMHDFQISGGQNRTITLWANLANTIPETRLFSTGQGFEGLDGSNNGKQFTVQVKDGFLGLMGYQWFNCTDCDFFPTSGIFIQNNSWALLAIVYRNDTTFTYVNGQLDNFKFMPSLNTSGNSNYIGKSNHTGYEFFVNGSLDDIGIWNRALSQQEITALYNATNCASDLSITPASLQLNSGSTASFSASTTDPNPQYRWQSDLGLGFQDLSNVGQYSGTGSNNLQVAGLQLRNHQQKFRVISTSGNCVDTSALATISLSDTCINVVNDTNLVTVTDTLIISITANPGLVQNTLKAYPNPTAGILFINTGNFAAMPGYSIRIASVTGQEVYNALVNQALLQVPLASLSPEGLFYLRLYDASGTLVTTRKIVLQ